MGTDITINIEKYTPESGWRYIGSELDILNGNFLVRNYSLYCILANQNSDYEWIDETTTTGFIPIASARGIPQDADQNMEYKDKTLELDSHERWHPSWVTLKEILDYPHWETYL